MSNLDKMKQSIKDYIDNMDANELFEFIGLLEECPDVVDVNSFNILTCDKCKEIFGGCTKENEFDVCEKRFMEYASREAETES